MSFVTIPLFPLISFVILILVGKRLGKAAPLVCLAALVASFLVSVQSFLHIHATHHALHESVTWAVLGLRTITLGFLLDPLSMVMCLVVTGIGSLIVLYSIGYMHGDPRYSRFFAYLSLFCCAMLTLVLADHLILLYIGWEVVGLCSYLLISFWFEKPEAARAGKKAFLTTRVGDLGLLAGILLMAKFAGSLSLTEVSAQAEALGPWAAVVAICLFWGAAGKSAQFPLHVWLPNAMEGPTSVSALIHAATMVAAGVYLVARTMPIFLADQTALLVVATIAAITSFFAATIACTQTELKKILAYSTISQLGFMMLGLGAGVASAGMFHLVTHAWFKALLFLGAGSVIHALHHQDIHRMGGLLKKMPVTAWTFIVASIAMAGVPPLSGFWSKEGILVAVSNNLPFPFLVIGMMVSAMTAFYISRAVILAFLGESRDPEAHPHESGWVMTLPLIVLAIGSIGIGVLGCKWTNYAFDHFLGVHGDHHPHYAWIEPASIALALGGIALAFYRYKLGNQLLPEGIRTMLRPIYRIIENKYYVDELYEIIFIRPFQAIAKIAFAWDAGVVDGLVNLTAKVTLLISRFKGWLDKVFVDGLVNGVAVTTGFAGRLLRQVQTGSVQNYLALSVAAAMVIFFFIVRGVL